jgi:Family of unknown function (DUF5706)
MLFVPRRPWVMAVGAVVAWLLVGWRWRRRGTVNDAEGHGDRGEPRTIAYAESVLAAAREELNRADTKASILLAATAAVIAAIIAGTVAGDWSPTRLTGWQEGLWWAATAVAGLAVLLLAAAIYPRTKRQRGGRPDAVAYYGDVVTFSDHQELRAALERSAPRDMDQLTDQVYEVGWIVVRKYRLLAAGMWALLISALGCSLAVAPGAWR